MVHVKVRRLMNLCEMFHVYLQQKRLLWAAETVEKSTKQQGKVFPTVKESPLVAPSGARKGFPDVLSRWEKLGFSRHLGKIFDNFY